MNEKKNQQKLIIIIAAFAVAMAAIFIGIRLTGSSDDGSSVTEADDVNVSDSQTGTIALQDLLDQFSIIEAEPVKASVDPSETSQLADELPELEDDSYIVKGSGEVDLTIFCSPEKASTGTDNWLTQLSEQFNSAGYMTSTGKTMSVSLAFVTSGLASDYIISGKYVPDLFTPSSSLWGQMVEASGVSLDTLMETTVSNTAGILVKNSMYDQLVENYGSINMQTIVEATVNGDIVTGYTNPYTSSTGLNFLVSTLYNYDSTNILSDKAVSGFTEFQKNVPYVGYNTQQMSQAASRGTFDAFILESQQYENSAELRRDYKFVPFGYVHSNPLYAVGNLDEEKAEAASRLCEILSSQSAQALAVENGFNSMDYVSEMEMMDGNTLIQAQSVWKQEKDSGKTIVSVFVADVSGSMTGDPLNSLKESLINSMQYIGENNYVGLISYNDEVTLNMPLTKFDLNGKSSFKGAVQSLSSGGNTASYSALAAAIAQIEQFKEENPDMQIKPLIFLLSDGETNTGVTYSEVKNVLEQLRYPVYTIGYNTTLDPLEQLSQINEAVCIDANNDDIIYQLKLLFNANL